MSNMRYFDGKNQCHSYFQLLISSTTLYPSITPAAHLLNTLYSLFINIFLVFFIRLPYNIGKNIYTFLSYFSFNFEFYRTTNIWKRPFLPSIDKSEKERFPGERLSSDSELEEDRERSRPVVCWLGVASISCSGDRHALLFP